MLILESGSWFLSIPYPRSQISDPGSKNSNKREVWKKISCHTFHLTKLKIFLFLKRWRKKFGPIFKELLNFLPKRLSLSSQNYGFGIRDPEKTYSGSRIQGSKRHRIPDLQHCCQHRQTLVCLCQNTQAKKPLPKAFGPSYVHRDPTMSL